MDWNMFKEFGAVGAITFLLFLVIKWTLTTTKDILKQAADERKIWQEHNASSIKAIEKITASIDRHDEKAEERGKYVREEHRQMIETLGRINGYKQ